MWYQFDIFKFAVQLVPPILRCKILIVFLDVITLPLRYIYNNFLSHREIVNKRLNITAGVQYNEKALNDVFFLKNREIYILSNESDGIMYWHYESEQKENIYMALENEEQPLYFRFQGEADYKASFTVYIPTFLCTSLDEEEDEYNGENLRTIITWLNYYKPTGKTYSIELYDYENA